MEAKEAIHLSLGNKGAFVLLTYDQASFDELLDTCDDFDISVREEDKVSLWSFYGPEKSWNVKVRVPDSITIDELDDDYHP